MKKYDIIILGMGPAGMSVAKEFINTDYSVLLIDNSKITSSVVMTFMDGIDKGMEKAIIIRYDSYSQQNRSVKIEVNGEGDTKLALMDIAKMRKIIKKEIDFDNVQTEISGYIRQKHEIILFDHNRKKYSARLIIDCSGAKSLLAKPPENEVSYYGYAMLANNCRIKDPKKVITYNSPDYTTSSIWIYPIDKKTAQIGLLEQVYANPDPKEMHAKLSRAISEIPDLKKILGKCRIGKKHDSHKYPLRLRKLVDDNIIFVGNSGGQATPFMGECFRQATLLGKSAARVAKKAVDRNKFSKRSLSEYKKEWKKMVGKHYFTGTLARDILVRLDEEELKELTEKAKKLSDKEMMKVVRSELELPILLKCMTPKMVWYLLHHLMNPVKRRK
ncbi:NAD(P)/FAD-dependent oxidoreductase [Thermoproteota archaeon]